MSDDDPRYYLAGGQMYDSAVMFFFILWDAVTLQAFCLMLYRHFSRRASDKTFSMPSQGLHSNYIFAPRAGAAGPCVESSQRTPRVSRHLNTSQRPVGDRLKFEERLPGIKLVTLELLNDLFEETCRGVAEFPQLPSPDLRHFIFVMDPL